eukprot:SAG31_NODE_6299_length_2077_cov_1.366026_3_plen_197_part_00
MRSDNLAVSSHLFGRLLQCKSESDRLIAVLFSRYFTFDEFLDLYPKFYLLNFEAAVAAAVARLEERCASGADSATICLNITGGVVSEGNSSRLVTGDQSLCGQYADGLRWNEACPCACSAAHSSNISQSRWQPAAGYKAAAMRDVRVVLPPPAATDDGDGRRGWCSLDKTVVSSAITEGAHDTAALMPQCAKARDL